jgi:hypothetical protein
LKPLNQIDVSEKLTVTNCTFGISRRKIAFGIIVKKYLGIAIPLKFKF